MTAYMRAALQPTSRKAYETHMHMWQRFVATPDGLEVSGRCPPSTLSDELLARFVTFMASVAGLAPSSCRAYVHGVSTSFRESGTHVPPLRALYMTSRVLKGVETSHNDRYRPPRQPLNVLHLRALYQEGADLEGCAVHVLAIWTMVGLFRGAELVAGDSDRPITLDHVLAGSSGGQLATLAELTIPEIAAAGVIVIQVDESKTKQRGTASYPEFRPLYRATEPCVCPILSLVRYLRRRVLQQRASWDGTAPLFVDSRGSPMTSSALLDGLREGLARAGFVDVDLVGTHSGRIGGSTMAKAMGMTDDTVRGLGGFSDGSTAVRRYMRPSLQAVLASRPRDLQDALLSSTPVTLLPTFGASSSVRVAGRDSGFPDRAVPTPPSRPGISKS